MYTQETPNPLAQKFFLGVPVVSEGTYLFSSGAHVQGYGPLEDLFLPGVASLLITPEFITVVKNPETSWSLLEGVLFSVLNYHLGSFPLDENLLKSLSSGESVQNGLFTPWMEVEASFRQDIEALMDDYLRPGIQEDGGFLQCEGWNKEKGILYVRLDGACQGCPHSADTLKDGIERTLTYHLPDIKDVVLV